MFPNPIAPGSFRINHFHSSVGVFSLLVRLSSSSDKWCRHADRAVEGFSWCRKIVDDILIWASTPSELESRIYEIVQRCKDLHVTLSRSKFQVDTSLKFAGCVVSASGVTPDPDRLSALANFPTPTDQTAVRSFLGLCNQLAFFVSDFSMASRTPSGI